MATVPTATALAVVAENVFRVTFASPPYYSGLLDAGDVSNPALFTFTPVPNTFGVDGNPTRPVSAAIVLPAANGDPNSVDVTVDRPMSPYPAQYSLKVNAAPVDPSSFPNLWLWTQGGYANYDIVSTPVAGTVAEWFDTSGNGRNLGPFGHGLVNPTIASAVFHPEVNGIDPVFFISDQALLTAVTPPPSTFASITIFVVCYLHNFAGYERLLEHAYTESFYLGTDTTGVIPKFIVNPTGVTPPFGNCQGGTFVVDQPTIITATFNGLTNVGTIQQDGVTVGTDAVTFTAPTSGTLLPIAVAKENPILGGSGQWDGAIAEIAIYTDCKAGGDLVTLNRYFGTKYAITVP
jgi:hypothetical protein